MSHISLFFLLVMYHNKVSIVIFRSILPSQYAKFVVFKLLRVVSCWSYTEIKAELGKNCKMIYLVGCWGKINKKKSIVFLVFSFFLILFLSHIGLSVWSFIVFYALMILLTFEYSLKFLILPIPQHPPPSPPVPRENSVDKLDQHFANTIQ